VGGDNPSNLTRKKKTYEISHTVMIFKDTIIYNALGFQYTGNLNNKRHINLSLYDKVPVLVIGDPIIKR
jgi:hypothetical protein